LQCVNCKREKQRGGIYECFYGTHRGSFRDKDPNPLTKRYKIFFDVAGREKGFVCRTCMLIGFLRSGIGLGIIAILAFAGALLYSAIINRARFSSFLIVLGLTLFFFGLILMTFRGNRGRYAFKDFGDNQLIRAHRREWKRQGFNVFLNRSQGEISGVVARQPETPNNREAISVNRAQERDNLNNPRVAEFYQASSMARSTGSLSSLDRNIEKERGMPAGKLMKKYTPTEGSPLYSLLTRSRLYEDEFLVSADLDINDKVTNQSWYVLTNHRLIQKDGRDKSLKEVILADVDSFDFKGAWTKTLLFRMKSGEEIIIKKVSVFPSEKALSYFTSSKQT